MVSPLASNVVRIDVVRPFWQEQRPDVVMETLWEFVVPVPRGCILDQSEARPHSRSLWLRYGLPATAGGNGERAMKVRPNPGNLRLFQHIGADWNRLEQTVSGLEDVSILDMSVRPGHYHCGEQLVLTDDQGCFVWQAEQRRAITRLPVKIPPLRSIFTDDGRLLALAFDEGTVSVFKMIDTGAHPLEYTLSFKEIARITVGDREPVTDWALRFAPAGDYLYIVKIVGRKHLRARLRVNDNCLRWFRSLDTEDENWAMVIGTCSSHENAQVCFAGLGNLCHHLPDKLTLCSQATCVGGQDVAYLSGLELIRPKMAPTSVALCWNPSRIWLTDLGRSTRTSTKVLVQRAIPEASRNRRRYARCGLDGNTLFAVVAQKEVEDDK
jgi:hypothetical protein